MRTGIKIVLILAVAIMVMIVVGLNLSARNIALDIVTPSHDPLFLETPEDYGLEYEDVLVITEDSLTLFGWYIPSEDGPTIMVLHGMGGSRQDL